MPPPAAASAGHQPPLRRGFFTLLALFSPLLLCLLLFLAMGSTLFIDWRTTELRRGNWWHEWLLAEPLSALPKDLIRGDVSYFWSPGDVGPESNAVVIKGRAQDALDLKRYVKWLESQGFAVHRATTSSAELWDATGRRAEVTLDTDGADEEIRIHVSVAPWIEF